MNIFLKPIYKLGDWLVGRTLDKWAKTPYLFDTAPNWDYVLLLLKQRLATLREMSRILTVISKDLKEFEKLAKLVESE